MSQTTGLFMHIFGSFHTIDTVIVNNESNYSLTLKTQRSFHDTHSQVAFDYLQCLISKSTFEILSNHAHPHLKLIIIGYIQPRNSANQYEVIAVAEHIHIIGSTLLDSQQSVKPEIIAVNKSSQELMFY